MIGLFFEVEPKPGHEEHYFNTAARLRPILEDNGGVLFIDRYKSLKRPGIILSYQHWQDEAHLLKWRADQRHQIAQRAGRDVHFDDYRIRVARQVTPDMAVPDSPERWIIAAEGNGDMPEVEGGETFASIYRENQFVTIYSLDAHAHALAIMDANESASDVTATHVFSVMRDYTMTDRAEAPQSW